MKRLNQNIVENLIYLIILSVVFIIPVFGMKNNEGTDWIQIKFYWISLLPFFILFAINNYFLIPRFLLQKRSWHYLAIALIIIAAIFVALPIIAGPGQEKQNDFPPPPQHQNDHRRPQESIERPTGKHPHPGKMPVFRVPIKVMHIFNDCIIAIFIIGVNIAIRLLFKSIRDERQIKELENHTLQAELNYLKAQINPHFFMNTLNNIHALVDIDTEKAKDTVIELSKIMRYVLYDANQSRVPLGKEILFLDNYINLMRIRFTDQIKINVSVPEIMPDVKIPPLLLITLIENAFKHGISHKQESFIYTSLLIEEDKLHYTVINSIAPTKNEPSGMGMGNLKKRLSLLYGENYTLDISSDMEKYKVSLIIPVDK